MFHILLRLKRKFVDAKSPNAIKNIVIALDKEINVVHNVSALIVIIYEKMRHGITISSIFITYSAIQ